LIHLPAHLAQGFPARGLHEAIRAQCFLALITAPMRAAMWLISERAQHDAAFPGGASSATGSISPDLSSQARPCHPWCGGCAGADRRSPHWR